MTLAAFALVAAGLVALTGGADALVRGASRLALLFGLSPLVVGLTVVAFGTSAPEIAASVAAALDGRGDLVVGNVVGSNVANVLFILGISAVVAPLVAPRSLLRFDVPLMIALSLGLFPVLLDGELGRVESAALAAGLVGYLWVSVWRERNRGHAAGAGLVPPSPTLGEGVRDAAFVAGGLILLGLGAGWLIEGATAIARAAGVSEAVVGLTVVAFGTSLPELATSMMAAWRGERDIAVGNIVGSNIFNLLGVLGIAGLAAAGGSLAVSSRLVWIDVPVMAAAAVAAGPVLATGGRVSRWEGAALVAAGLAYLIVRVSVG